MATKRGPTTSVDLRRQRRRVWIGTTLLGTAASGIAIHFYSRFEWPWLALGWLALVPWLAAVDHLASWRAALAAGYLMSCAFAWALFPWFPALLSDYGGYSPVMAMSVFLIAAPLLQPQFVFFALARHAARGVPPGWLLRAVAGAGVYVGAEWLLFKTMGDTLGHAQFGASWIRQSAEIFGAHGITWAMILFNEGALAAVRAVAGGREVRARLLAAAAFCLALLAALNAYGALRVAQIDAEPAGVPLRVVALQANIGHYDRLREEVGTYEAVRRVLDAHFSMSDEALRQSPADLVLWPETVYPTTFGSPLSDDGAAFDRTIGAFVRDQQVPLIFGAFDRDAAGQYNAAILLEPDGTGVSFEVYRKMRLFPLTEYLPSFLERPWVRRLLPWAGTWLPGTEIGLFTLRYGPETTVATPLICYDAIDPRIAIEAVRRGAELLVTMSNDSWFPYAGVRELILVVSAFRSIETRRPQVRATPTGISAVIDATGRLVQVVEADRRGTLVADIAPRRGAATPMVRWGEWFPPAALIVGVLAIARSRQLAKRRG